MVHSIKKWFYAVNYSHRLLNIYDKEGSKYFLQNQDCFPIGNYSAPRDYRDSRHLLTKCVLHRLSAIIMWHFPISQFTMARMSKFCPKINVFLPYKMTQYRKKVILRLQMTKVQHMLTLLLCNWIRFQVFRRQMCLIFFGKKSYKTGHSEFFACRSTQHLNRMMSCTQLLRNNSD